MSARISILLILFLGIFSAGNLSAVPAFPGKIEFIQPDGTKVSIFLKGDEKVRWAETEDGYALLFNAKGFYEYAQIREDGDMVCSGIVAKNESQRVATEREFLNKIPKHLRYSKSQVSLSKQIWEMRRAEAANVKAFPTTGSRKLVCVLIGFTDKAFSKTQADFNNLFNQAGYATGGATGSVHDFFAEASYNRLDLSIDVFGPYTAANAMAYYGGNDANGNDMHPEVLATEAVTKANATANFANYDNDGNGTVDGVYVIYAGYGEEAGGSSNAIWAHAWQFPTVTMDGKTLSTYSCSAEMSGNSGTTITKIGVICHEFGHVLGAPDYYDTDYETSGQYDGTGDWDLQAGGSWNNNGATPAHPNAYTKCYIYNWATATTISIPQVLTLNNSAQNAGSFYRYETTTKNEFFLLENRQKVGFDAYVPGHGLLIYHVDGAWVSSHFSANNINNTSHQGMFLMSAVATTANGVSLSSANKINVSGCTFPGTSFKTSFTDATTPNSKSWAAANTAKPITNITENSTAKTVTFTFISAPVSSAKDITAFTVPSQIGSSVISTVSRTVTLTMPYGTNLTALIPTIAVSANATITPASGVARNFTTAQTYTVTAQDGTTQTWTVTVSTSAGSSSNNILTFSIPNQVGTSVVDNTNHTVSVSMPAGTNVTALVPTITISALASVNPASGLSQNFTNPVNYTVTSQNGTSQVWAVTVSVPSTQSTIFTETMGTVAATTTIAAHETNNGFDNDAYTMSGTGDVRITSVSSGYIGASGSANVYLTTTAGKYFQIEGINTVGCSNLVLTFGMYTSAIGNAVIVEVSSDGTNYTALSVSPSETAWSLKTAVGAIPQSSNLRIRFKQPGTTSQIRIDDVKLVNAAQSVPVSSVTISPATLNLTVGGANGSLTASVLPVNASNQTVTWLSSNTNVATVNSYGYVTPISAGTASITATASDGNIVSNTCSVTVTAVQQLTAIFTETIGTVTTTTAISTHETNNGFDNDTYTMSGTGDVRITSASSAYTGASGSANVYLTTTVGKYFQIEGINTIGFTNLSLSFGMYTSSKGNAASVEVSSDGVTYTALSISPSVSTGWHLKTAAGTIPQAANLRIRFKQTATSAQIRIDDIKLVGMPAGKTKEYSENQYSSFENLAKSELKLYPNPASDFITFETMSEQDATETISIFDASGKFVYSEKISFTKGANITSVNISQLTRGLYFMKIGQEVARIIKD